jgi:phosphoglycolate phosphatase
MTPPALLADRRPLKADSLLSMVEQLRHGVSAKNARVCVFDFDGTISLIRSGWMDVMVPMMVEILLSLHTGESETEMRTVVEDFVWRLTGKQTMYQMIAFAHEISKRGGTPRDPLEYKNMYLERLHARIHDRLEELRRREVPPDKYLVPGARAAIEGLRERGLRLYLASGTDEPYMREEADLLDIARYFEGRVYGALDDYRSFSKKILIEGLIAASDFAGAEFLGFGDGYVEIENIKEVGGVAVGVATAEPACETVDEWKRQRLAGVGADFIIPNFLCHDELFAVLFPNGQ